MSVAVSQEYALVENASTTRAVSGASALKDSPWDLMEEHVEVCYRVLHGLELLLALTTQIVNIDGSLYMSLSIFLAINDTEGKSYTSVLHLILSAKKNVLYRMSKHLNFIQ